MGAALLGSVPPFFFENGGFEFQPGEALCLYTFQTNIVYTAFIETVYVATTFHQQIESFQPRPTSIR